MDSQTERPLIPTPMADWPPEANFDTVPILKALVSSRASLEALRSTAKSLPNPGILLDTLFLQEALASSEIENVVTTQDEAFQADITPNSGSPEAKEVARYREAMRKGYDAWRKRRSITENMLIEMFRTLKERRGEGYRRMPGTVIRNQQTGENVHVPPQDPNEVVRLMRELEAFINEDARELDPLIRMALIHYQFESIHPFSDGNGRVGRMLNVLYLTHTGLLDLPILYLSRAINSTKPEYYRLLQAVREEGAWEQWVLYMLQAVADTAVSTLRLVEDIRDLMQETKQRLRRKLPKIYSQDLLNNLFRHPYTRIEFMERDLSKGRLTASKYLKQLAEAGLVKEVKEGRSNYYVNEPLVALFLEVSTKEKEPSETFHA